MPKPGPPQRPSRQRRWFQERTSPYPWEQDGLDHVRRLMPDTGPYRAWALFSFTAASGRINECDLLIATPGGLHLVELKGHPGQVVNRGDTWLFRAPDSRHPRTLRNPLHLVDLKSKELRTRLDWAANQLDPGLRVPRVEPSVFLSAPGLRSGLDEVQRARVYGRDGDCDGLPWIWRDLLGRSPRHGGRRITEEFSRMLPDLLARAGLSVSVAHLRFGDGWTLDPDPLDVGRSWEDRLARRSDPVRETGRLRIYLTELQATDEARESVERAARREYQVLGGITHRGIAQPMQIGRHSGGPAILFRHRAGDLRLDSYLAAHAAEITPETRLDLVRQLGEAVRYAHGRGLYHRALSARAVYVSARADAATPVLRVIDWQAAVRDADGGSSQSPIPPTATERHLADAAGPYLAPEFDVPYADPVDLDVFGLGAVSYLVITGQPPATSRAGLVERVGAEGGLHPYAVADGVSGRLDDLVYRATRGDLADRMDSAEAFLDGLDLVERDAPGPDRDAVGVDPLAATPGQAVDGPWTVERVLGTGSTARALLVTCTDLDADGAERTHRRVLKVALDEDKATRLHAESRALDQAGGGVVVKLLGGPRELAGRTVLDLEYAGEQSLGARLRAEGPLSYHDLERFGGDLFTALDQLAGKGVWHRDLKPDNFGVFHRADRSRQLMLFDFSLAEVSGRDIGAGTRGYLDPFLGPPRRQFYDDHAERYAAAVTLHEMASGQRPVWGDGVTNPRTTADELPALAAELFEPALRDGLTAFFHRALHRDTERRFDTLRQMRDAWQAVFAAADASAPATTPATVGLDPPSLAEARDAHADAAEESTPLEAAGLSPRAVSVAHAFGATTVGALLDVPLHRIAHARGAGALVRKELNRRHKQWTAALRGPTSHNVHSGSDGVGRRGGAGRPGDTLVPPPPPPSGGTGGLGGPLTVDDMAALLTPAPGRRDSHRRDVIRLALGLPDADGIPAPWPTQSGIARTLGITKATVSRITQDAAKTWAGLDWLTDVRDELVDVLVAAGRVMTAAELAGALRARHGAGPDTAEPVMARATGVVRAAVDAETWAGLHPEKSGSAARPGPGTQSGSAARPGPGTQSGSAVRPGPGERSGLDGGPRLAVSRRGRRVLVAAESLPGTDDPSPAELADYAAALGQRADALAGGDPLPGRGVVERELRAVPAPDGLAPLADTRLVELAAAMSERAAASPRLELYPRDLGLVRALRLAQVGAGVRRGPGIGVDDILARVRARFPDIALPGEPGEPDLSDLFDLFDPARPEAVARLGAALAEAGFPMEYDPVDRRFRPPAPELAWPLTASSTALSAPGRLAAAGLDPVAALDGKLRTAARRGGFLALTLRGNHLPGAADALAGEYPVTPVDINRAFLAELRRLLAERGQDWDRVLGVDARIGRTGQVPRNLAGYLRAAFERVADRLAALAAGLDGEITGGERPVLLAHDAGLLARYFDSGGRDLLTGLQHAARRPDRAPHGLWLLCPAESARHSPNLDGRTVECVDASEWAALGGDFWDRLAGGNAGSAA